MTTIAVIADDLTGAADTGVQFCPYFGMTILISYLRLSPDFLSGISNVLSIFTNSRAIAPEEARDRLRRVASRVADLRPNWIYKKVDSCLRGNIGIETEAIMDTLGYEMSFIAPAFPAMGRTTVHDIHLLNDIPVSQTELARDPVTPVMESRLSRVVSSQCRYAVDHVDLSVVDGDENAFEAEIECRAKKNVRHLVFDAVTRQHLDRIASFVLRSGKKIILVGSAGLADSLGCRLTQGSSLEEAATIPTAGGKYLLVCGTMSETVKHQLQMLQEKYSYDRLTISPNLLADPSRREKLRMRAQKAQSVLGRTNLIVSIDTSSGESAAIDKKPQRRPPEAVAAGLGYFVARLLEGTTPAGLFLTGGDTADAVLSAVQAFGIRLSGEIVPGLPQGTIMGGFLDGLAVVTKAGTFGQRDTLVVLHETWKGKSVENRVKRKASRMPDKMQARTE
jgi:D-threonate/D-erythronate kinase